MPCFFTSALNPSVTVSFPFEYVAFSPQSVAERTVAEVYSPRSKSNSVPFDKTISLSPPSATSSALNSAVTVTVCLTVYPSAFLPVISKVFTPASETPNASAFIVNVPFANEYAVNSLSPSITLVISVSPTPGTANSLPISSVPSVVIASRIRVTVSPSIPAAETTTGVETLPALISPPTDFAISLQFSNVLAFLPSYLPQLVPKSESTFCPSAFTVTFL